MTAQPSSMAPQELLLRLLGVLNLRLFLWLSRAFQGEAAEIGYMHTCVGTPPLYMEMTSFCQLG
jgi:hypothetical protein